MKKILMLLAIALVANVATAEEVSVTKIIQKPVPPRIENRIEQKKDNLNAKSERIENRIEAKKEKMDEATSTAEKIKNKAENIEKRIEVKKEANKIKALELVKRTEKKINAAIGRIELLANRVAERLNILADKGVVKAETKTQVEAKLNEAKTLIAEAKAFSVKIMEEANISLASSTPKEAFKSTKEVAKEAEDKIKEAHAKVVEAVTLIKASTEKEMNKATTTDKSTTTNQ